MWREHRAGCLEVVASGLADLDAGAMVGNLGLVLGRIGVLVMDFDWLK